MLSALFYKHYHPEIFQGHLNKHRYFEGWYFKFVNHDETQALAVIPGIALYDQSDRHAFIQVIDGVRQQASYYSFPLEAFSADTKSLEIQIGNNSFSMSEVSLDLPELKGKIAISDVTPIHTSMLSPGIMGWYSFVPGMQCYHGVVSMHHMLDGQTDGTIGEIAWQGGVGYLEKDWGTSFPKCWIWIHSNHFGERIKASVMASVAHIPWMGSYFPGFIVTLMIDGQEYRFATYNGSKMKCRVEGDKVCLAFKKGKLHLEMIAHKGPSASLRSPISGRMTGKVNESLQATLDITLRRGEQVLWQGAGTTVGLEVAGETQILETEQWRK